MRQINGSITRRSYGPKKRKVYFKQLERLTCYWLTLLVPAIYTNRTTEWHLAALYFVLATRECARDRLIYRLLIYIVYKSIFISSTLIFVDF